MHVSDETLKTILGRVVEPEIFSAAQAEAEKSQQSTADVLIARRDVPEYYLLEMMATHFNSSVVDLRKLTIPRETLNLIPKDYAKSHKVVAFEQDQKAKLIKVAMVDPADYEVLDYLRFKLESEIKVHLTASESLRYALRQYDAEIGVSFNENIAKHIQESLSVGGETNLAKLSEAVSVVNILNNIIEHAIELNSSDIHLEPMEEEVLVRYRVDGTMREILTLPKVLETILVARVKILSELRIDEHRLPQDGRFRFELIDGEKVDIRVSIMPMLHGEKVEMRLLQSSARPLNLSELGFTKKHIEVIREEIKATGGMVLSTGPTGHGKTTTLYALLYILNKPNVNITTIEDPIEYEIARVNQTQVNTRSGITFANGLRSILRQNPDIIMVGEMRDNETVEIGVRAALTGHLVLSTLHTNDAAGALPRLIDMGAPPFLLSSTINLVIAQRLVQKICTSCISFYDLSKEMKDLIASQLSISGPAGELPAIPTALTRGKGCNVCNGTGFRGQTGVFEILRISDKIRELILRSAPASEIRKVAIKEGMAPLFHDAFEKVKQGVTTIEEALRVVRE